MGSYSIFLAELVSNIRDSISGAIKVKYRHNSAHDVSLWRLLALLQVDVMVASYGRGDRV
jgi:acid phosphatase